MKKFTFTANAVTLLLCLFAAVPEVVAQATATLSPSGQTIFVGSSQTFTITTTGFGGNNNNRTFTYTISGPGAVVPASPAVFTCTTGCNSEDHEFTFPTAGVYNISVTAVQTQGTGAAVATASATITVVAPSLWATSASGTRVSGFGVSNGTYIGGPREIFNPTTGSGVSTAALAISAPQPGINPGDPFTPYFYWLPNTGTNSGVVEVWGATLAGTNQTLIGTLDINGASTNSLGFVRLGMGPNGVCYLLAGDGATVYLASFRPNGVTPNASLPVADRLKIDDADGVTLTGGTPGEFQNGDLAVLADPQQGGVNIYALANVTDGATKIFIGKPNGNSTTFTKRWDLVDPANAAFTGTVNGVAFDQQGSIYISTGAGLFFVNAATANATTGTVTTSLVWSGAGLQDLASNAFPAGSTLPVVLRSFSGSLQNGKAVLSWETEQEINFDYFEVERSHNAASFRSVGRRAGAGDISRGQSYVMEDDLSSDASKVFYYRLKMVDKDGKTTYSNVLVLRKTQQTLKNLVFTPNPVQSAATVTVESATSGIITLRVLDMSGRLMFQQTRTVGAGSNSLLINGFNQLQPGQYILQSINGTDVQTTKFSKL